SCFSRSWAVGARSQMSAPGPNVTTKPSTNATPNAAFDWYTRSTSCCQRGGRSSVPLSAVCSFSSHDDCAAAGDDGIGPGDGGDATGDGNCGARTPAGRVLSCADRGCTGGIGGIVGSGAGGIGGSAEPIPRSDGNGAGAGNGD